MYASPMAQRQEDSKIRRKLVIVGDGGSGKTSLLMVQSGLEFPEVSVQKVDLDRKLAPRAEYSAPLPPTLFLPSPPPLLLKLAPNPKTTHRTIFLQFLKTIYHESRSRVVQ
jgi:GTPase SAR1 family protein